MNKLNISTDIKNIPSETEKSFKFSASHRLLNVCSDNKCHNIHGHNYKVNVGIVGSNNNEQGMALDVNDLKPVVQNLIDQFDHSTILNEDDTELIEFYTKQNLKLNTLPGDPTSENIAGVFLTHLTTKETKQKLINAGITEISVTVKETDTIQSKKRLSF